MSETAALFAKLNDIYIIKLVGNIQYTMGCALDEFFDQLFLDTGFNNIVLDLTEVTGMDSTSLGLLAKLANFVRDRFATQATLVSTNEDINCILENVGFYEIFYICDTSPIKIMTLQPIPNKNFSKPELSNTVFNSHNTLSQLNDKNRETFKGVIEVLKHKVVNPNSP
jgi:anti-anti-sigma factor